MNIAVVVTSCDAFQECWEPFIYSVNKYWDDCPWDIYLISNYNSIENNRVKFIKVGEDKGWASNLKNAINQIDAEYIIYLHEDFFINKKVNTEEIVKHFTYCKNNKIDYLGLNGPFFDKFAIKETFYALSPQSKRYRLCLQSAIWNKLSFNQLLINGFNAWQFEWEIENYIKKHSLNIKSIVLQSHYHPDMAISYVEDTAVHKGMWTVNGYNYLIKHGFENILIKRRKEGEIITFLIHNKIKLLRPFCAVLVRILLKYNINI